jgi:hypothetical protein
MLDYNIYFKKLYEYLLLLEKFQNGHFNYS